MQVSKGLVRLGLPRVLSSDFFHIENAKAFAFPASKLCEAQNAMSTLSWFHLNGERSLGSGRAADQRGNDGLATELLRGPNAIIGVQELLRELAVRCGQEEATADIHYYLDKPGLLRRVPVLLLIRHPQAAPDNLAAAVLLFEYKVAGIPLGMYTSNDRSGRRTVIAAPGDRLNMAICGAEHLLRRGANVVLLALRSGPITREMADSLEKTKSRVSWVFRQREIPDYLPLRSTYDETLAQIGKRTRTHMRYYRRQAEAQLGCTFHPQLEMGERELSAFNRICMYPVGEQLLAWRLRALRQFDRPILMALRDSRGELLSVLAGRRFGTDSDVLWQMNRRGLDQHSLSLVMRTYFIEHEISCGMERVYLDGGSGHSLCHSFARGTVTHLAAIRHTPLSFLVRKTARRLIPQDNHLARLLAEDARSPAPKHLLRTE